MSTKLIRKILRGDHRGKLCTIAHEDPKTGLLYARVAPNVGDPAPGQFDFKVQPIAFTPSWLQTV